MTRPTGYDPEIAQQVLDRIADGAMLTEICKDETMPTARQFRYWLTAHDDLAAAYARARLLWSDTWAERVMDISFNPKGGAVDEKGNAILDHALIALLKLQTDNAKWLVGKWAPRTYGEASQIAETPLASQSVRKIERVVIRPQALAPPDPQLAYTPLDTSGLSPDQWQTLRQVLELIDRAVGERPADEVFGVLRTALCGMAARKPSAP